jgi:hypothetical protein
LTSSSFQFFRQHAGGDASDLALKFFEAQRAIGQGMGDGQFPFSSYQVQGVTDREDRLPGRQLYRELLSFSVMVSFM